MRASPTRRSLRRRLRQESSGQALVEFAIVAPLMVLVLLFSIWFYELIFVRLKAQEAARYAAWEATAYKLHDYAKGPAALPKLALNMQTQVMADTMIRYSSLDSARFSLGLKHGLVAASFAQPVVLVSNGSEEQVPGGWMPNLLLTVGGSLFDWVSAKHYKNPNSIATTLIGAGKVGQGKALQNRMFGDPRWGFNSRGYAEARVGVMVTNNFFGSGVGRFLVSHQSQSFMIWEKHGVLADSWRLDDGGNVYGGPLAPGRTQTAFAKQVGRMYLMNHTARAAAKAATVSLWALGTSILAEVQSPASVNMKLAYLSEPAVVSLSYGDKILNGKAVLSVDRPGVVGVYDTLPAPKITNLKVGKELRAYGETLRQRGPYFMGCDKVMSLGCPSSGLQQDNPFGGYLVRE